MSRHEKKKLRKKLKELKGLEVSVRFILKKSSRLKPSVIEQEGKIQKVNSEGVYFDFGWMPFAGYTGGIEKIQVQNDTLDNKTLYSNDGVVKAYQHMMYPLGFDEIKQVRERGKFNFI